MTKEQAVGSLALPVADAARLAGPHLDPRVEGLRVQGIAVSSRQFGPNRAARFLRVDARFLRTHMRNPGAGNHDPFGLDEFGLGCRLSARLCALASAIRLCFDLNRREFGRRPERLRREQRLGKVEAQELVGTILIAIICTTLLAWSSASLADEYGSADVLRPHICKHLDP